MIPNFQSLTDVVLDMFVRCSRLHPGRSRLRRRSKAKALPGRPFRLQRSAEGVHEQSFPQRISALTHSGVDSHVVGLLVHTCMQIMVQLRNVDPLAYTDSCLHDRFVEFESCDRQLSSYAGACCRNLSMPTSKYVMCQIFPSAVCHASHSSQIRFVT